MSRAVVVGAGLGGLAGALRLQGQGYDVTVVEQRERPGGRAYQIADGGFTWDTGPSIITMPWVLEETLAAGGVDLHTELKLRRLDPMYRISWAGEAVATVVRQLRIAVWACGAGAAAELGREHLR